MEATTTPNLARFFGVCVCIYSRNVLIISLVKIGLGLILDFFKDSKKKNSKDIDGGDPDSGYLSVSKGTKLLVTAPLAQSFHGWSCK